MGLSGGLAANGGQSLVPAVDLPAATVIGATDTLVDAKGDLLAGTADNVRARLGVGSDGQVLTADAASTPGVKWAANSLARTGVKVIASFNGATDGTVINAALTALGGPGTVMLPVGTGVIDTTIHLAAGQWLIGAGWGTVLQAANSLNAAVIANTGANDTGVGILDLVIDGNRANNASGAGISFDWTGTTVGSLSPYFWGATVQGVYIRFTAGDGYVGVNPTTGMGTQLVNVWATRCNGNGFNVQHSDSIWVNVNAEKSGLASFSIGPNAAGLHLTNCTGNDGGQVTLAAGYGYKLQSGIIQLTNCMAQHNSAHGYYLTGAGAADCMLVGCIADGNSFANGAANAAGFYVDSSVLRTIISGCSSVDRQGSPTQAYGFFLNGTCDGVKVSGSHVNANVLGGYVNNSSGTSNEFVGKTVPVNAQSGTTYTFTSSDIGKVVESTGGSAATFTIPTNATGLIPLGAMIEVFQQGAGQVTIAAAGGVTLVSDGSKVHTAAQNATIALRQRATDVWVLSGDLS